MVLSDHIHSVSVGDVVYSEISERIEGEFVTPAGYW